MFMLSVPCCRQLVWCHRSCCLPCFGRLLRARCLGGPRVLILCVVWGGMAVAARSDKGLRRGASVEALAVREYGLSRLRF